MAIARLTKAGIQGLPAGTYYDDSMSGFGLRIGANASTWFVEYRPGAGGRGVAKKRFKVGRLDKLSPEKAREVAGRLLAGVALGDDPAGGKSAERASLTVKELADEYLRRHVRAKRKASSAAFYELVLDKHVVPALGAKRAAVVTRSDVSRMHDAISTKSKGRGGPIVANRALAVLSALYGWAGKAGLAPEGFNPAIGIERFKEEGRERYLTSEEIARLGDALREAETIGVPYEVDPTKPKAKHAPKPESRRTVFSPHITGAIRLLMLTGCRLREILNLRWSEVDAERGLLFLPDSKTGRKAVVMSQAALDILAAIPRIGAFVIAGRDAGTEGEKARADLKKPWAAICKRAGLDGLRIHDLRHTFASVGAGGGLGLPIIGKLLGHADTATTQKYAHLHVDPVRAAADAIADKIAAQMEGK